MTKRWSSTASGDGQTKRQASKAARRKASEMAKIAEEYGLDPLGDFIRAQMQNANRLAREAAEKRGVKLHPRVAAVKATR